MMHEGANANRVKPVTDVDKEEEEEEEITEDCRRRGPLLLQSTAICRG